MLGNAAIALLLLVCVGLAMRNRRLAGELAAARWALSRALDKELKTRPPKVHVHVVRPEEPARGGDAA